MDLYDELNRVPKKKVEKFILVNKNKQVTHTEIKKCSIEELNEIIKECDSIEISMQIATLYSKINIQNNIK